MTEFLHGAETIEQEANNFTIQDADISSVAVIGTMPTYELCDPKKVTKVVNYNYKGLIGSNIEGFTIPDAVQTILDESGGANIYCINIFDNLKHTANVDKTIIFDDEDKCVLAETGIQNLVVTQDETTLQENVDYEFDGHTITILEGGALENNRDDVTASYKYVDFTKITDADVIGSINNNTRTGIQAIWDIVADYGIVPGIVIAPGFSSKNVRNALEAIAERLKAFTFLDGPKDLNVNLIEKARLKETEGVDLTTSSDRSMLCVPYVFRYNQNQDVTSLKPLSPVVAGLRVKLDRLRNCAKSIDNTVSKTILGTEFPISFMLDDPQTDSNRINALGVTTVINRKGSYYIWGGRNSSFISKAGIKTFEACRRTSDFIQKSIQEAQFVCIGEKITKGFIDNVVNTINDKFAAWSGGEDPYIYGGEAYFDETLNTAENIANGHLYLPWSYCPVGTVERITNLPCLDIRIITKALNG